MTPHRLDRKLRQWRERQDAFFETPSTVRELLNEYDHVLAAYRGTCAAYHGMAYLTPRAWEQFQQLGDALQGYAQALLEDLARTDVPKDLHATYVSQLAAIDAIRVTIHVTEHLRNG